MSVTTFERPVCDSCILCHPSQNSQHHFLTTCMLMTSLPQSAVYEFQPHSYFLLLKTVSLHGVHIRKHMWWVALCSLYYSPRSFGQSHQQKIQCCYNPKQNISTNFHNIRTVRWRRKKMGNLLFGQPIYEWFYSRWLSFLLHICK